MKLPATHCLRGHPRTPENLKTNGSCKQCERDREKAKHALSPKPPKTQCKNGHPKLAPGPCKACKREAKKRYLKAHPEVRREKERRYAKAHPEVIRAQRKRYFEKHPEAREKARAYAKTHPQQRTPEQKRAKQNKKVERRKLTVLTHYGPQGTLGCCWEGCSVTNIDMLTLDHLNDDGAEQRRALGKGKRVSNNRVYAWIKSNNYPEGFQTLCANHQLKKEMLKHREAKLKKEKNTRTYSKVLEYTRVLKGAGIPAEEYSISHTYHKFLACTRYAPEKTLGCSCAGCGVVDLDMLTIDHTNNDGAEHRKSITVPIYRWLVKNNFPEGFQTLCANHNVEKEILRAHSTRREPLGTSSAHPA